jgi:hypothetical protein
MIILQSLEEEVVDRWHRSPSSNSNEQEVDGLSSSSSSKSRTQTVDRLCSSSKSKSWTQAVDRLEDKNRRTPTDVRALELAAETTWEKNPQRFLTMTVDTREYYQSTSILMYHFPD